MRPAQVESSSTITIVTLRMMLLIWLMMLKAMLTRDVTTRRCLTSYERVEEIVRECATIKTDLDR